MNEQLPRQVPQEPEGLRWNNPLESERYFEERVKKLEEKRLLDRQ